MKQKFVPVVDANQNPLMPTKPSRARKWIESGKATPFWKKGIFCVRLNKEPSDRKTQPIAVGIDPGSKREGFTVKSKSHTYLNVQSEAVDWVKDHVEQRKNARRNRRQRKTPFRKPRFNNKSKDNFISPSTKARWQWKIRIVKWLMKMFPLSKDLLVIEDVKAITKKYQKKWNSNFSPVQTGKNWLYNQLKELGFNPILKQGHATKELRDELKLHKTKNKLSNSFDAHCVDSWVLANSVVGGHSSVDNKEVLFIKPLRFHRRQLHVFVPTTGGKRKKYGGTISMGLKRGSLVKHPKYGICYVGGTSIIKSSYGKLKNIYHNERISLHSMNGRRISNKINPIDCKFLCYNNFGINYT